MCVCDALLKIDQSSSHVLKAALCFSRYVLFYVGNTHLLNISFFLLPILFLPPPPPPLFCYWWERLRVKTKSSPRNKQPSQRAEVTQTRLINPYDIQLSARSKSCWILSKSYFYLIWSNLHSGWSRRNILFTLERNRSVLLGRVVRSSSSVAIHADQKSGKPAVCECYLQRFKRPSQKVFVCELLVQ